MVTMMEKQRMGRRVRPIAIGLLATLLLGSCALNRPAPVPAVYDLGPAPPRVAAVAGSTGATGLNLAALEVTAPPWLAGPGLVYRLAYRDPLRRELYRDSRWAAAPAALLAERLRQRAAAGTGTGTGTGRAVALRLELEAFEQVFVAPERSEVRVRLRAWTGEGKAGVFDLQRPAATPDAAGAVKALGEASEELIGQLLAWAGG